MYLSSDAERQPHLLTIHIQGEALRAAWSCPIFDPTIAHNNQLSPNSVYKATENLGCCFISIHAITTLGTPKIYLIIEPSRKKNFLQPKKFLFGIPRTLNCKSQKCTILQARTLEQANLIYNFGKKAWFWKMGVFKRCLYAFLRSSAFFPIDHLYHEAWLDST